jgi:hypothetical protein
VRPIRRTPVVLSGHAWRCAIESIPGSLDFIRPGVDDALLERGLRVTPHPDPTRRDYLSTRDGSSVSSTARSSANRMESFQRSSAV